jgi:hypothetical protein
MMRPFLWSFVLLAACESGPNLCATVVCGEPGTVCSPADGLCHCGSPGGELCEAGYACEAATSSCAVPDACRAPSRWTAGTTAFAERTAEAGLTGVLGVRLSAVDYDGDGWTDLFVRNPSGWDDFAEGGSRFTWLLHNRGDGTFEDVTEASRILTPRTGASGGRPVDVHAFGDVDGDGDLDVYLGLANTDPARTMGETAEIMLQQDDHTFVLGPEDSRIRLPDANDTTASASFVDVDLDGDLDLWTPHHGFASGGSFDFEPSRLYLNDGSGRFTDESEALGIATAEWSNLATINDGLAHARAWSGAACDLNGDGRPELLSASYGRAPNHLWQWTGSGYENRSLESGYAYDDNQTWQDDQFARCYCQANPSAEGCAGAPAPMISCGTINWAHDTGRQPFRLGGNSGTTSCGDVDNDGDLDLLTSEIVHWWAGQGSDGAELLVNAGTEAVTFERPGRAAMGIVVPHDDPNGWNEGIMTNALFDFDNDGWLDVFLGMSDYPGNHAVLYHQTGALSFEEVPRSVGIDHHRSHGIAVADFDRDGDLDVVLGHSRARCGPPDDCYATPQIRLFDNLLSGNFLSLHLVGTSANRSAVGARVTVRAGGLTMTREVEGGHGHYGMQDDLVQHVGLGAACEAEVTVRWPVEGLPEQTFTLAAGHRYRLVQGEAPALEPAD